MALRVVYTAPKISAGVKLAAAAPIAAREAAAIILDASQDLVPVDKGDLKASGRLDQIGNRVRIVYDATSPDGYPYGIKQHEDMTLHHPHGGQAKFLEQPLHSHAPIAVARIVRTLRAALRL